MNEWVLVFIIGHGERSIEQAMVVARKGYDNAERERIIEEAKFSGVDTPEIIGSVDIPEHIASQMCEGRTYIG